MCDFWINVKTLLKAKKKTQKNFSLELGLSERAVETWIFNDTIPDAETSVKIASHLGTTVEFLVNGSVAPGNENMVIQNVVERIPEDLQQVIDKYATKGGLK